MSRYQSRYSLEDNSICCPIVYERQPHITVTTLKLNFGADVIDLMRRTETMLKQCLAAWGTEEPEDADDYEKFEAEQDRVRDMLYLLIRAVPDEVQHTLLEEVSQGLSNYPAILDWMQRVIADEDEG
jgi:hypothetical protein